MKPILFQISLLILTSSAYTMHNNTFIEEPLRTVGDFLAQYLQTDPSLQQEYQNLFAFQSLANPMLSNQDIRLRTYQETIDDIASAPTTGSLHKWAIKAINAYAKTIMTVYNFETYTLLFTEKNYAPIKGIRTGWIPFTREFNIANWFSDNNIEGIDELFAEYENLAYLALARDRTLGISMLAQIHSLKHWRSYVAALLIAGIGYCLIKKNTSDSATKLLPATTQIPAALAIAPNPTTTTATPIAKPTELQKPLEQQQKTIIDLWQSFQKSIPEKWRI